MVDAASVRTTANVDRAGELLARLRRRPGATISDLAADIGMARSTVQQRIDALAAHHLVEYGSAPVGARGRPAQLVRFRPSGAAVLAAHVGLTGSRIAVLDLSGEVVGEAMVETTVADGPEQVLTDLITAMDGLLPRGRRRMPIAGVGVGLPSTTDLMTFARSRGIHTAGWSRTEVARRLRDHYHAPVFLDLDVNLLALAERTRHSPEMEVFVCAKLGTLIDVAIVVNGQPVHGADGLAGELGHVKVAGSTAPCSCGSHGCLNAVASGSALVDRMVAAGESVEHVREVVALAEQGHPGAIRAIRDAGQHIGRALAGLVTLLNPGMIAVWGYLADAESTLFAGIRAGLYADALPRSSANLALVRTSLGDLTGVRGAGMMVIAEVLSPAAVDRALTAGAWSVD